MGEIVLFTPLPVGDGTMTYDRTQRAPWGWILGLLGGLLLGLGIESAGSHGAWILSLVGGVILLCAGLFSSLNVRDERDRLAVRFGPLPMIRWEVMYADIEEVEAVRSTLLDGWGMHWAPGQGWTLNVWGFDCVEVHMRSGRRLRIGTDEPLELKTHLLARME
ncbi:MAG: hypothetical protein AAGG01_04040 [Planctomycetota bacterium]